MSSRNYCFTLNNYTTEQIDTLKGLKTKYIGWAEEVGESGTPHLQGLVCFLSKHTIPNAAKHLCKAHVEVKKGTFAQARDYFANNAEKGEPVNLVELGVLPMDPAAKGEAGAAVYAEAISLAKEGKIDDIAPGIQLKYYKTLEYIHQKEKRKRKHDDVDVKHDWYYGTTGTGKSRKARQELGTCYQKRAATKWWDGYEDGDVLIEDFDKKHEFMGHDLKIWLDRYPFPAEKKGSQDCIRPPRIIITSNYHPSEIWSDSQTLDPILRRLNVTEFLPAL